MKEMVPITPQSEHFTNVCLFITLYVGIIINCVDPNILPRYQVDRGAIKYLNSKSFIYLLIHFLVCCLLIVIMLLYHLLLQIENKTKQNKIQY